jgi:hypothetical protein
MSWVWQQTTGFTSRYQQTSKKKINAVTKDAVLVRRFPRILDISTEITPYIKFLMILSGHGIGNCTTNRGKQTLNFTVRI